MDTHTNNDQTNLATEASETEPMLLRRQLAQRGGGAGEGWVKDHKDQSGPTTTNNNNRLSMGHEAPRRKQVTSKNQINGNEKDASWINAKRDQHLQHQQQQPMFEMNGESISEQLEKMNKRIKRQKRVIIKNIVFICIAYFLCFASFVGVSIIQSSIVGAVGTIGLGVNFGCSIFGCIVLAPIMVRLVGCKYSMMIGFLGFLLWVLSNFYPVWGIVLPAAAISGLCFGPLFAAQATYFAIQGEAYAKISSQKADVVVTRLFGLFFCLLYMGASVGCLITSTILNAGSASNIPGINNSTVVVKADTAGPQPHCGANFCPGAPAPETPPALTSAYPTAVPLVTTPVNFAMLHLGDNMVNMTSYSYSAGTNWTSSFRANNQSNVDIDARPLISKAKVLVLVGTHSGLMALAFIIITLAVNQIPKDDGTGDGSICNEVKRSVLSMLSQLKRPRQLMMTPINIYTGLSQSFVLADITGAYIACSLGFGVLGYTLAAWGAAACVTSMLCSLLMRRVGRIKFFTAVFIIRLAIMIFLIIWVPDSSKPYVFFIIPAVWAIGDGFLISQLNSVYGIFFADNTEGAFSAYRFYESIGMVIGYGLNSVLCVKYKLFVLLGLFIIGMIGYYVTERRQHIHDVERRKLSALKPRRRSEILVESFLEKST